MRWIYISPHLDDAVLSAGGLIHDQASAGIQVEIWTLVCGFPPEGDLGPLAQMLHFQWGFASAQEAVHARRAEDKQAASIVGAKTTHFDFPDCIYRRGTDSMLLYPLDVFVAPHPEETNLPGRMAAVLAPRLTPQDILVCPLTVGGHVDHILVRQAVEQLGHRLWYYADVPYVLDHPEVLAQLTDGGRPESHEVSSTGMAAWQGGIEAYASQISTLFASMETMRTSITAYGQDGFHLWGFD